MENSCNHPSKITANAGISPFLQHIPLTLAENLCDFYNQQRITTTSTDDDVNTWHWFFEKPTDCTYCVLTTDGHELSIAIDTSADDLNSDTRLWWEYPEDSRLLAWGLQHQRVLTQFERLFSLRWSPCRFTRSIATSDTTVFLGWRLNSPRGAMQGHARLCATLLSRLKQQANWQPGPNISPVFLGINFNLCLQLPVKPMAINDLKQFKSGDILLADVKETCWQNVYLATDNAHICWHLVFDGHRDFTVTSANPSCYFQDTLMSTPTLASIANTEDSIHTLDDLPVNLSFQLATKVVTLAELQTIQPGYIFKLFQPLENLHATLLANGKPIGTGALVNIGNCLGIQLLEPMFNGS